MRETEQLPCLNKSSLSLLHTEVLTSTRQIWHPHVRAHHMEAAEPCPWCCCLLFLLTCFRSHLRICDIILMEQYLSSVANILFHGKHTAYFYRQTPLWGSSHSLQPLCISVEHGEHIRSLWLPWRGGCVEPARHTELSVVFTWFIQLDIVFVGRGELFVWQIHPSNVIFREHINYVRRHWHFTRMKETRRFRSCAC